MAESGSMTSSGDFKIGDLVWAKVKGFSFWPGEVCEGADIKMGRKIKNPSCVRFFGANNFAWVGEESIKPYEDFREKYANLAKTVAFRNAVGQIEEKYRVLKGGKADPLNILSAANNGADSKHLLLTPQPEKSSSTLTSTPPSSSSASLFKAKKANSASAAVQRDYSRTPFKKEKRNFESEQSPKKSAQSPLQKASESSAKKRARFDASAIKKSSTNASSGSGILSNKKLNDHANDDESFAEHNDTIGGGPSSSSALMSESFKMESIKMQPSSTNPSNLKFGFIGVGRVGQQVLQHIITAGHEVSIWNRTPSKCKEFEKLGAMVMKTPGDVIREADITFSCLSDATASTKIFFGNCGVASEINASKGYVELSSLDPQTSTEIESAIKDRGGRYLEAPLVHGLPRDIASGHLVAMVAGNRSLFDDCGTCFEAICSHVYFLDEKVGAAAKMNLVLSSLVANVYGSLMESLTLVDRIGLMPKDFVEIINRSSLACDLIKDKMNAMIDNTLVREIPVDHIRRDLNYTLSLANNKNFPTPITSTTNEVFKQKQHHYY